MTGWVAPDHDTIDLQVGCQFDLRSPNATTAVLQVAPHFDQTASITGEWWDGALPHRSYADEFANRCERFALPAGEVRVTYSAEVSVSAPRLTSRRGMPGRHPVEVLADDLLRWVMPSRFCQPDELGSDAWHMFGSVPPGWARVQAICDFVNAHLAYVHGSSNPWTTAADAYRSGQGVCRDFAHLAITFCRALNIPGPIRVRLHPRHRQPPPVRGDGLRGLVRGPPVGPLAHLRRPAQRTSHRSRARRTRSRRGRRGADDVVRCRRSPRLRGQGGPARVSSQSVDR